MPRQDSQCPTPEEWMAYLDDDGGDQDMRRHAAQCESCRAVVSKLHGTLQIAAMYEAFRTGAVAEDLPQDSATRLSHMVEAAYQRRFSTGVGGCVQWLAVMFTDMASSTEYAGKYGDEAARRKQERHNELLLPLIDQYCGTLIKNIGDALMVIFDRAIDAARCAVAMQRVIQEYNRSAEVANPDQQIHVRVGIHWGKAVVYRDRDQLDVCGTAANVAARVESGGGKQTDQILLSEAAAVELSPYMQSEHTQVKLAYQGESRTPYSPSGALGRDSAPSPLDEEGRGEGELRIAEVGTTTAKGVGPLRLYRLLWNNGESIAPLKLAAQTAENLANPMQETADTRGIHCLFVDPASGRGNIRPVFVKVTCAEAWSVRPRIDCDRIMQAAVTRAAQAAFDVLQRIGFGDARADRHAVEWWIEGPAALYEGASIGLGAALATAAAYTGVSIDRAMVVTGATDGDRVVKVAGLAAKWKELSKEQFTTLVLPNDNMADLLPKTHPATELHLLSVASVEEAVTQVLGAAIGLAGRRVLQTFKDASGAIDPIAIDLRVEPSSAPTPLTRAIGVAPRRPTFFVGDHVRFSARPSRDCHLSLVNVGSSGNVTVLLPNDFQHDAQVRAGEWHTFPAKEHGFALPLLGPPGVEKVMALASEQRLDLEPKDFHQSGQFAELTAVTRAIGAVAKNVRDRVQGKAEIEFYVSENVRAIEPPTDRSLRTRGAPPSPPGEEVQVGRAVAALESEFRWVELE